MDDHQSSNEIREDINQTRAAVGSKIDQLQARLDPQRLKAEAAESVQEMLEDTAHSVTDYVRTHKDEMIGSVTAAARRNPLPTALVGLGLGWLLLESMSGNRDDHDGGGDRNRDLDDARARAARKREYEDHEYEYSRRYLRSRGRIEGGFSAEERDADYSPEYYDEPQYGRVGYPASVAYGSGYSPETSHGTYPGGYASQDDSERERGNPVARAANAVKEKASDMGHEIKERVQDASHEAKDRMSDAQHQVRDRVSDAQHEVRDRMSDARHSAEDRARGAAYQGRHQAEYMGEMAQRRMGQGYDRFEEGYDRAGRRANEWRHQAGHQMHEWGDRARYESRRRGRQLARNLEDNPLTYGAVALAAGAALALLLPQTRTENRAFGGRRDELFARGQETWESARHHAQEVVDEVRPEVEQKAREFAHEVAHDVKETGQQIAHEAKEEMRPVVDKAVAKSKDEARSAAQEAGVDPDKVRGQQQGNATLNRDTLQGQWKQVRGEVKSRWGKLTDDDLTRVEGDYDKLVGSLQTRYGYTRERAEQEVNSFFQQHKRTA